MLFALRAALVLCVGVFAADCATHAPRTPSRNEATVDGSASTIVTAQELARSGRDGSLMEAPATSPRDARGARDGAVGLDRRFPSRGAWLAANDSDIRGPRSTTAASIVWRPASGRDPQRPFDRSGRDRREHVARRTREALGFRSRDCFGLKGLRLVSTRVR